MKEVNPQETTRAYAFEMWLKAPNPMVTFIKTLDITRLVKVSRRRRLKFNMLLNWCIGKSAASVKEFYLLCSVLFLPFQLRLSVLKLMS